MCCKASARSYKCLEHLKNTVLALHTYCSFYLFLSLIIDTPYSLLITPYSLFIIHCSSPHLSQEQIKISGCRGLLQEGLPHINIGDAHICFSPV